MAALGESADAAAITYRLRTRRFKVNLLFVDEINAATAYVNCQNADTLYLNIKWLGWLTRLMEGQEEASLTVECATLK